MYGVAVINFVEYQERIIVISALAVMLLVRYMSKKTNKTTLGVTVFKVLSLLTSIFLLYFNVVSFMFSLILISFVFYKFFEYSGDKIDDWFKLKLEAPKYLVPCLKYMCWLVGTILYFRIIDKFINYTKTSPFQISEDTINFYGVAILSLVSIVFIVDFLRNFIFDTWNDRFEDITRLKVQGLFIKIIVTIIFSDFVFSSMYLSFSGYESEQLSLYEQILFQLNSFYYSFCLHFAVPMPTTTIIVKLDELVKKTPHFQVIQFFHFCINKIVDLTILAYIARVILDVFELRKIKV
jgi:hypothetical protein